MVGGAWWAWTSCREQGGNSKRRATKSVSVESWQHGKVEPMAGDKIRLDDLICFGTYSGLPGLQLERSLTDREP